MKFTITRVRVAKFFGHPDRFIVPVSPTSHPKYPSVWICLPIVKWEPTFDAFEGLCYQKRITRNAKTGQPEARTPDPFQICALDLKARNARPTQEKLTPNELAELRAYIRFAVGDYPSVRGVH